MKRIPLLVALASLTLPAAALAQSATASPRWTLTLLGGIHEDRFAWPERFERQVVGGAAMGSAFTGKGEAPTAGLRATRWLTGHLGLDAGLALAHNSSWHGTQVELGSTPRKLTLFSSVAPVVRIGTAANRYQLQLGAGPALITHTGTGETTLARSTDFGGMAMADLGIRLSRRLHLVLGGQNYRFSSRFAEGAENPGYVGFSYPTGNVGRSEWVITTGLRVSF